MNNIDSIKKQLDFINQTIFQNNAELEQNPDDFAQELTIASLESHRTDLLKQLELLLAEQEKSLIEIRLIGTQVINGSIPLRLLSKIAEPFSLAVTHAASYLHSNENYILDKEAQDNLERSLDLRLSALGIGSTRLYITGNMTEDLGGESLLPATLEMIFNLLNAKDEDSFYDIVHEIGHSSAKQIEKFISVLDKENLNADCLWESKKGHAYSWCGKKDRITEIKYLLEKTGEPTITEVVLSGVINLLSDTGRIGFTNSDGTKIKVIYKNNLFPQVTKLNLGDRVSLRVEKTSFFDETIDTYIHKYKLIGVIL